MEYKFLLLILLSFDALGPGSGESSRVRRFDDEDETSTLITCDGGQFTAQCTTHSSVHVLVAEYGRNSTESICAKTGMGRNEFCRSPSSLERVKDHCRSRMFCQMEVNPDNLGRPVKEDGSSCFDTSKYLRLVYRCIRDCAPPDYMYNAEAVGEEFHVGSSVIVRCREGYERVDGMEEGVKRTCVEGKGWVGPTLLCQDIDECANPSGNRCHKFATCQNTRGSYSCTCLNGYQGDGITCNSESWFTGDDWVTEEDEDDDAMSPADDWDEAIIEVHDEKVCGKRIIKSRQGVMKSPGNPMNYPSHAFCVWIIAVPPGLIVELRFMKFEIERKQRNEGCSHDNVTIYDGLNRDPRWWMGTYCGDEAPPPLKSQTNKIRIEFKSDDSAEFSGFVLRFYAVDLNSACLNFPAQSYKGIVVVNGTRNATTQPRDSLLLGCDDGYVVASQNLVRTCGDDGKWDVFTNPCAPVSCGDPYIPLSEEGLTVNAPARQFRYGELPVRYECEIGYRIHVDDGSDDLIYCDKKGRWSNSVHKYTPWCEKITCVCQTDVTCAANEGEEAPHKALKWQVSDHDGIVVTQPVGQTFSYGSQIKYSCAEGYSIAGDEIRLCTEDGWSGRRTTCEEAGVGSLSNQQIAIIASAASGFVILVIAVALIICCCRDHAKKTKKRKQTRQRRMRAARDNEGFVLNMAVAGNEDFLYGHTIDRKGRNKGFVGRHNDIRKYQARPHVLPSGPPPTAPPSNYYNGDARPATNQTFRPPTGSHGNSPFRLPPVNQNNSPTRQSAGRNMESPAGGRPGLRSSPSKISSPGIRPPPGYADPPPSYDTMVREGYSSKSGSGKHGKRRR